MLILKQDLITYLNNLKEEYKNPSQEYVGKDVFPKLWKERLAEIKSLDEIIPFTISDQKQIQGPRGYVNSGDFGYKLLRMLSLPLVSYISAMKIADSKGKTLFYWKLFVDFEAISEKRNGPLVFNYGKKGQQEKPKVLPKKNVEIINSRNGQGKYRSELLEECPFCPITMVNDDRLLIASHIKPWAVSTDKEKIDSKNGFMLTPLYDKLFDRGFITFTDNKHMLVSNWLSPSNCKRLNLKNDSYFPHLPINEKRKEYLKFHRESVFKG